jgi:hypothetical protein
MGRGRDPRWDELGPERAETDPWLLGVGDAYGRDLYEAAGVPAPMIPGVQPWQTGEPVGKLDPDHWLTQRFEAGGWQEPFEPPEPVRCGPCGGAGCHACGFTGWLR